MIKIEKLGKKFGNITALADVSCSLAAGEIVGLLGPNGAGKTTLMRIITGVMKASSGAVFIKGKDIDETTECKRNIGYMPEISALYDDMTVADYLRFIAEARKIAKSDRKQAIAAAAEDVRIENVLGQKIGTLSKGYKRRVSLAQAIIHKPDILVLDEPTEGLDPNQKKDFYSLIKALHKDRLIVISTHVLDEVNRVCTKILLIDQGKLILDVPKGQLQVNEGENLNDLFYRLTKTKGEA